MFYNHDHHRRMATGAMAGRRAMVALGAVIRTVWAAMAIAFRKLIGTRLHMSHLPMATSGCRFSAGRLRKAQHQNG